MPNSEYLRLKALLDNNPRYKTYLDTISKAEGTWGNDAYSTTFGGGKSDWKKGKDKTVRNNSSAHGKYQFMNDTWFGKDKKGKHIPGLQEQLGLSSFSPEEQDVAALKLAENAGVLKHIDNDEWDKAIFAGGKVWMGMPINEKGDSADPKQKAKPLSTVLGYTKSNEAARASVNDAYKKLNESNLSKSPEEIKQYKDDYIQQIRNINAKKSLSPSKKEKLKHDVKSNFYREGKLLAINQNIKENNVDYIERKNQIKKIQEKVFEYNQRPLEIDEATGKHYKRNAKTGNVIDEKEIFNLYKEAGFKPKFDRIKSDNYSNGFLKSFDLTDLTNQIKKTSYKENPMSFEKHILKYGKTKDEYDLEVAKNAPKDTGSSETMPDATTTETPEEAAARKEAEAKETARGAKQLAEANKPKSNLDLLDSFNDDSSAGYTKFNYTPGKGEIPFEALIGLTTGLAGMAAADDVHTKLRDEQISEGMLQYAQDIAKIKNIGLSPEIEGGLKMKLQDAYQTGLTNIVRASNGNRNLVLGNQAQLDKARMSGIVEIAAMDVDRTDKAMAAFGEVQKYINEFDSRRDIANNDRQYQDDKAKQLAGMELAKQGMSSFIDAIENAKENAPGSMNDMRRQYFQFTATGILPNAVEGEPGSKSFLEAADLKNKMFKGKIRTYSDWINTMDQDQKELLANILAKNPQMNPTINKAEGDKATEFNDLENYFKEVSGDAEKKKSFLNDKGVTDLDVNRIEEKKTEISGTPTNAPPILVDKQYLASTDESIKQKEIATRVKEPQISPRIVTTEKVPDVVLSQNLADKINNDATITPEQRGNALSEKAELILQQSEKGNQKLDNMTNNLTRQAEQDAAYNARLNLVTRQKQ